MEENKIKVKESMSFFKGSITKQNADIVADSVIANLNEKAINVFELWGTMNFLELTIKNIKDRAKGFYLDALELHGLEKVTFAGAKIEKAQKTDYDFESCKDPVYDRMVKEMETLKENIKKRETFLKSIIGSQILVDGETGESYTVEAPIPEYTVSPKVTLSK